MPPRQWNALSTESYVSTILETFAYKKAFFVCPVHNCFLHPQMSCIKFQLCFITRCSYVAFLLLAVLKFNLF